MRIKTISLAASLTLAMTAAALAQGAPGGNGSGGNVTGGSTTGSSASEPGNLPANGTGMRTGSGSSSNPAGVIDGTNPNPDADRAGGIRAPGNAIGGAGAAGGAVAR